MIDSVLKGTGNSRFLKSAVPAGTSWADALAMLQAGTFPIDFNGINTEGFQQVGTPLNKANLLKDATAAQIGLPPSTTPDGMFQALGNTGELHVWRKTVVTKEPVPEVPGSYKLGSSEQLIVATRNTSNTSRGSYISGVLASNSLSVDLEGNVSLENPVTIQVMVTGAGHPTETANTVLSGCKYFMIPNSATGSYCEITMQRNTVYFVQASATYTPADLEFGSQSNFGAAQLVTGVPGSPAIPAGTTTTYPVSTNPNAYQEGDDAKPAGYTLGEVVSGLFLAGSPADGIHWQYSDSISVQDNGSLSLDNPSQLLNAGTSTGGKLSLLLGKFARLISNGSIIPSTNPFYNGAYVYIPADTIITSEIQIDRYQPVTGYAAIPAGTTIEYLGKLGDKARVQVVSYVGTGTYGKDNKNQLTFSRKPRFIMVPGDAFGYAYIPKGRFYYVLAGNYATLEDLYCVWDDDTNTMTWYHPSYPYRQYNQSGTKYTFVAIY